MSKFSPLNLYTSGEIPAKTGIPAWFIHKHAGIYDIGLINGIGGSGRHRIWDDDDIAFISELWDMKETHKIELTDLEIKYHKTKKYNKIVKGESVSV